MNCWNLRSIWEKRVKTNIALLVFRKERKEGREGEENKEAGKEVNLLGITTHRSG